MLEAEFTASGDADFTGLYAEFGDRFYEIVDHAIDQLRAHPHSAPVYAGPFRRLILRGTNHGLFYAVEGNRIMIAAFLDLRDDPKYISRRLFD